MHAPLSSKLLQCHHVPTNAAWAPPEFLQLVYKFIPLPEPSCLVGGSIPLQGLNL